MNEAEKLAERLQDIATKYRFVSHEHGVIDGAAALLRSQAEQIKELAGENDVLLGLLTDCAAVIRTIDPESSDEAEKLADMLVAIDRAQSPHRHEGSLL